ncbi:hypothetical protein OJAV_G00113840 [Oryzias javanicus]|uniref:Uncharacterized protein n=1 Tax=Oryzias javanicus TaxID=123683 RepID=A0A3S2MH49_ORYJA|nr:hypothetical protein OJAV_G00113840 [Oryzias javanicus]
MNICCHPFRLCCVFLWFCRRRSTNPVLITTTWTTSTMTKGSSLQYITMLFFLGIRTTIVLLVTIIIILLIMIITFPSWMECGLKRREADRKKSRLRHRMERDNNLEMEVIADVRSLTEVSTVYETLNPSHE